MDAIVIENFRPYDGRYDLDLGQGFTTREWGWLKRLSGYLPLTVEDGYRNYDPEFWCVFTVILLRRAGRVEAPEVPALFERLIDQEFEKTLRIEFGPREPGEEGQADEDPTASSNGRTPSSGPASSDSSETPTTLPSPTPSTDPPETSGTPGWVSSGSGQRTSES